MINLWCMREGYGSHSVCVSVGYCTSCSLPSWFYFFRRVIEEILHTEEAYVADLKLVVEVWL